MDSNSLDKKRSDEHLESEKTHSHINSGGDKGVILDEESNGWDPAFIKKTMRRVDLRVLPMLATVYALSL